MMKNAKGKDLWIVTHHHRYGVDVFIVSKKGKPPEERKPPTESQVIKALDIDFEEDREEYIDIDPLVTIVEIE